MYVHILGAASFLHSFFLLKRKEVLHILTYYPGCNYYIDVFAINHGSTDSHWDLHAFIYHRLIESFELERTSKGRAVQLPCNEWDIYRLFRALSILPVNVLKERVSTKSLATSFRSTSPICVTEDISSDTWHLCLGKCTLPYVFSLGSFKEQIV